MGRYYITEEDLAQFMKEELNEAYDPDVTDGNKWKTGVDNLGLTEEEIMGAEVIETDDPFINVYQLKDGRYVGIAPDLRARFISKEEIESKNKKI